MPLPSTYRLQVGSCAESSGAAREGVRLGVHEGELRACMLTPHDPETIIGVQMPCDLIELSIDLFELAARTVPEATEMINDTHASLCHRICSLSLACTTPSIDP